MLATTTVGDGKRYIVGVSGITTDGEALVFRGSAGINSGRERKAFTVRLPRDHAFLLVADYSLVLSGLKKQVADRFLQHVSWEEGNDQFLRLGPDIQIMLR